MRVLFLAATIVLLYEICTNNNKKIFKKQPVNEYTQLRFREM